MAFPSLNLLLSPLLTCNDADQCINVRMTLDVPATAKNGIIFHHILARGPIKTMQYTSDDVKVQDSLGPVPIYSQVSED
jgi:hypothetical protein